MNRTTRSALGFITFMTLILSLGAQERSITVQGTAGAGGTRDEVLPAFGTDVGFRTTNFLDTGHHLWSNVGLGYAGIGYGIVTRVGFLSLQALGAPFQTEYAVVEEGRKITLDMEAPLYRVGLGYVLPTEAFSLNMAFCMESRSWKSDSPLVVAPADSAAWEYRAGAEYRLGRVAWSSAPFAGDRGWSFSGGYRAVRRWGYRPWGVVGTLFTHDGAPQHQMHLAAAFGTELGDGERPHLLRFSVRRERAFNSYERNRPRYGHAGIPFMTGVSGYIPESPPATIPWRPPYAWPSPRGTGS